MKSLLKWLIEGKPEKSNFDQCVEIILKLEGGYVNDPADPGGETNFGISKRSFPSLDIKNLTEELAKDIYNVHYWSYLKCGDMPLSIALCVFDCAVNQGVSRAAKWLQEILDVKQDGVLGPKTFNALQGKFSPSLVLNYQVLRAYNYGLTANYHKFGKIWMHRVLLITSFGLNFLK